MIGIHSNTLEAEYSLKEALHIANELGYDGYEIDIGFYADSILEGATQEWTGVSHAAELLGGKGALVRRWASHAGIDIHTLCLGSLWRDNPASDDPEMVERAQAHLSLAIRAADALDADAILVPPSKPEGMGVEHAQANFIHAMQDAIDLAERHEIELSIENIRQISNFFRDVDDMITLIDTLDSDACGIYYDVGNAALSGFDPVEEILELGEYITEMHMKDPVAGENATTWVGNGMLPWEEILECVDEVGYDGYFTVESSGLITEDHVTNEAQSIARRNISHLREIGFT